MMNLFFTVKEGAEMRDSSGRDEEDRARGPKGSGWGSDRVLTGNQSDPYHYNRGRQGETSTTEK